MTFSHFVNDHHQKNYLKQFNLIIKKKISQLQAISHYAMKKVVMSSEKVWSWSVYMNRLFDSYITGVSPFFIDPDIF